MSTLPAAYQLLHLPNPTAEPTAEPTAMSTYLDTLKDIQTLLEVQPDGVAGPVTQAAWKDLCATAASNPGELFSHSPASAFVASPPAGGPIIGDDSVEPISALWISRMTALTGVKPAWIGRYVGPGRPATYQLLKSELPICAAAGIRIALVAEQTRNVGGSLAEGLADGKGNAQNIFDLFPSLPAGSQILVYLDVEGSPSLSEGYWQGWSQGLASEATALSTGGVNLLPGIYASENDGPTWKALSSAIQGGAHCAGSWVASYITTSRVPVDPAWDAARATMNTGDSTPDPSCPVQIWQFAGGYDGTEYEALDPDLVSPSIDGTDFLSKLILPG